MERVPRCSAEEDGSVPAWVEGDQGGGVRYLRLAGGLDTIRLSPFLTRWASSALPVDIAARGSSPCWATSVSTDHFAGGEHSKPIVRQAAICGLGVARRATLTPMVPCRGNHEVMMWHLANIRIRNGRSRGGRGMTRIHLQIPEPIWRFTMRRCCTRLRAHRWRRCQQVRSMAQVPAVDWAAKGAAPAGIRVVIRRVLRAYPIVPT